MAGNFDRDFGYLMPFLDKMSAAATDADPRVRSELSTLVAGEKARWQRIQALLSGADVAPPVRRQPSQRGPAPVRSDTAPAAGFTVGSLRRS